MDPENDIERAKLKQATSIPPVWNPLKGSGEINRELDKLRSMAKYIDPEFGPHKEDRQVIRPR